MALGVLALIRGIDVVDEGRRRRVRRLTAGGASAIAPKQARRKGARRRSLRFVGMGTSRAWRAFIIGNAGNFRKMQEGKERKDLALDVIQRHVNGGPTSVAQWLEHRSP